MGARCGIFLKTGDLLVCFEKILPWFASLFGQPDRLRKQNNILDLERGIRVALGAANYCNSFELLEPGYYSSRKISVAQLNCVLPFY